MYFAQPVLYFSPFSSYILNVPNDRYTQKTTEGVNTMIFACIFVLYALATMFDLLEELAVAFAPVINSGSGVLAIAFITAVVTYRRLQARKGA